MTYAFIFKYQGILRICRQDEEGLFNVLQNFESQERFEDMADNRLELVSVEWVNGETSTLYRMTYVTGMVLSCSVEETLRHIECHPFFIQLLEQGLEAHASETGDLEVSMDL